MLNASFKVVRDTPFAKSDLLTNLFGVFQTPSTIIDASDLVVV